MTGAAVHTTCPYCGVGCGVVAQPDDTIKGDAGHPSNRGRLCSKGAALASTLDDSGRLVTPTIDGQAADWDRALDLVSERFRAAIAEHGSDSVAFYVSGQCLTEDYYVANKLMKGFIGSANIDTNSRLCMASSVAGHVRAFGEDVVPGVYEDWDEADLVVLVGSNAAWCHPVLHQRMTAARQAHGTKVVVLDPRRTATAEAADLHLPLAVGTDVALFNGLLQYLVANGRVDAAWVERHTVGLEAAVAGADGDAGDDLDAIAATCGIDPEALETFYDLFARTERVMTVYSQGVNQSSAGTDKVNAIINCHLATGRIGRPGMGPFSVTGQPNAMGGREVGGLANQLAAHMRFDDPADRAALQAFWNSPTLAPKPGLKAVDLFDAVLDGRIKALWIVATNPAVSLPRAGRVRDALKACPFVVVSDCWPTDTSALAHVVLPAAAWGEKDGTVTSSERRISRQRPFREAPGDARSDWWQFAEVGRRMGWADAFAWTNPAAVFREHAALSAHANDGRRIFDIGAKAFITDSDYDAMPSFRWPLPAGATTEAGRLFAEGGFSTPDGKARFVPTPFKPPPKAAPGGVLLNTGRIRDQWHTMTRTGLAPALMSHTPEPTLSLHPADADAAGIADGSLARLRTDHGEIVLRAELRHTLRHGEVFAPMHWTDQFSAAGPVDRVVTGRVDPVSGQPELKATPATIEPVAAGFHGLLLRRSAGVPAAGAFADLCHWSRIPVNDGQLYRLTGLGPMPAGEALGQFAAALTDQPADADWLEMTDRKRGVYRVAIVSDGALEACLFLARHPSMLPAEQAVIPMIGAPVSDSDRASVLSGRMYGATANEGPKVCACFGVSRDAIRHAIATENLTTARQIGERLRAGTNCGSCIPELEEILRDVRIPAE
ncbi:MAG TPA: molybdopterin-dependent oxidoreductase [Rhodopila sp.]|uniref:molybdopterin-dependent oxidoreductase n=1 Tax=Rhodopila sp. TaxID=2480087 RepID=UPI002BFF6B98|nr:molybdopterin-dependent oxidoreductase [Rhodopila sp.]HVY17649.1 molybdopterin-dependent oxidoreductase [Rhodopila sp.]